MIELIKTELKMRGKETYSIDEIIEIFERYTKPQNVIEDSGFIIDTDSRVVIYDNIKHDLPLKEFLLMDYLMRNKNKVARRNNILSAIWGDDVVVLDRTIDVHIRKIRERFPTAPIQTIKCVGYIWKG